MRMPRLLPATPGGKLTLAHLLLIAAALAVQFFLDPPDWGYQGRLWLAFLWLLGFPLAACAWPPERWNSGSLFGLGFIVTTLILNAYLWDYVVLDAYLLRRQPVSPMSRPCPECGYDLRGSAGRLPRVRRVPLFLIFP